MKRAIIVAAGVLGIAGATRATQKSATAKPEAVTITAAEVKFGPAPPNLPPGAQLAVLHGDPTKKGRFTMRVKVPDGYKIPPHWHSNDEELTIISGTFMLSMGDKPGENVHTMPAGSYHFLPGKMRHAASVRGETVVQVNGNGPFDLNYVNPADDPTKKSAGNR
jgi:quercetin dioxygenase-like cupin family protein